MWDFIWNLIADNWEYLIGLVLAIGVVSMYLVKLRGLLREVAELFIDFDKAFEDNKISKAELLKLKQDAIEVWNAVKAFVKK